jgi:hypothetical protein
MGETLALVTGMEGWAVENCSKAVLRGLDFRFWPSLALRARGTTVEPGPWRERSVKSVSG